MSGTCIRSVSVILALVFAECVASAQWENMITCHELYINVHPEGRWNGVVPICMDTFRIGLVPAKRRHAATVDGVCARLFRLQPTVPGKPRMEIPIDAICEGPNLVTVIAKTRLAATDNQGQVIWYQIEQYCSYWHGARDTDTSRITFRKATGCKAYARAIDMETGEDITAQNIVAPVFAHMDHYIDPGVQLTAYEGAGYRFVEWTSTDEHLLLSRTAHNQILSNRCWPIMRAVEFIGKFRKVTSALESSRGDASPIVDIRQSHIRVTDRTGDPSVVEVYNMCGSLLASEPIVDGLAQVDIESFSTGLFIIVVKGTSQTRTHSFIHLKE